MAVSLFLFAPGNQLTEYIQGIIATMVQLFFAWRLHVLTKKWWIVSPVVLSSSVSGRMYAIIFFYPLLTDC